MDKATARHEKRKRQEQDATSRIARAANVTDPTTRERIARILKTVYAEWGNTNDQEHAEDIAEHLARYSVSASKAHYTGDSSYPTEHTIKHERGTGTGPTFDLALVAFIERLLQGGTSYPSAGEYRAIRRRADKGDESARDYLELLNICIHVLEGSNSISLARGMVGEHNDVYGQAIDDALSHLMPVLFKIAAGGWDGLKWYVPEEAQQTDLESNQDTDE
jgi:hypothetical protein